MMRSTNCSIPVTVFLSVLWYSILLIDWVMEKNVFSKERRKSLIHKTQTLIRVPPGHLDVTECIRCLVNGSEWVSQRANLSLIIINITINIVSTFDGHTSDIISRRFQMFIHHCIITGGIEDKRIEVYK